MQHYICASLEIQDDVYKCYYDSMVIITSQMLEEVSNSSLYTMGDDEVDDEGRLSSLHITRSLGLDLISQSSEKRVNNLPQQSRGLRLVISGRTSLIPTIAADCSSVMFFDLGSLASQTIQEKNGVLEQLRQKEKQQHGDIYATDKSKPKMRHPRFDNSTTDFQKCAQISKNATSLWKQIKKVREMNYRFHINEPIDVNILQEKYIYTSYKTVEALKVSFLCIFMETQSEA
ncbi:hypothetical protein BDF20DRAFT_836813 [Mycotypha africana]|uniref:uncharacterized protein n=1 Tax=Mycotypha africana TaxID=64632 RepID=UPI00230140A7|nr:uncharacterized protein BDF20DRAFT_836813 [Mycotypha africana]KAI8975409.1 hypothetical protein BDF20DRAFT_836813 [Mycotypha africana]